MISNGIVPELIDCIIKEVPKVSGFYNSLLKFALYLKVHDQGKKILEDTQLVEVILSIPLKKGYTDLISSPDRFTEYHKFFNDLFRDSEVLLTRGKEQVIRNVETLKQQFTEATFADPKDK